jgi:tRNA A37 threonylcarbamoyladenosine synthetase subunit TsaC/SUA5/YrdC
VLTDADEIVKRFGSAIAGVIAEPPGEQPPSQIINLLTGEQYR